MIIETVTIKAKQAQPNFLNLNAQWYYSAQVIKFCHLRVFKLPHLDLFLN